MIVFVIVFVVYLLLDAVILPGLFVNYFGFLMLSFFLTSMLVIKNQKYLVYLLIVFGFMYEILQGYAWGTYILPLLSIYLILMLTDYFVNLRGYFSDDGAMKYALEPFVGIVCFIIFMYVNVSLEHLINRQNYFRGIGRFSNISFLVYLYVISLVDYRLFKWLIGKHAKRI